MPQPYNLLPRIGSTLAEEWLHIGLNHQLAGRVAEAQQAYYNGLRIDPAQIGILTNLGVMMAQLATSFVTGKIGDAPFSLPQAQLTLALQYFERAVQFDEKNATTLYNYALALLESERQFEALTAIDRSLAVQESDTALCAKGMILTSCGRAAEAIKAYDACLKMTPQHPIASYNAIFARTLVNTDAEDNGAVRKRFYENFRHQGPKQQHDNDRAPSRPLRVGYVGGDFKMHSAAFIFSAVVLGHDKTQFEPYCYMSMGSDKAVDGMTKRFAEETTWRDISALNDDDAEKMIRTDKIDILVDLSGHTGGNRLALFTRKPAPIAVHAWGFAHGSGIPEIDYFFADPYSVPEAERQHYAEKIWDLPSIVTFAPAAYNQPGTSPSPVTRDGIFTFGVFGRFEKYSPQALEAWHKIMLRTRDTRIIFKDAMMRRPCVVSYIRDIFHDIDPKRTLFMQECSHPEQMLTYQQADLMLDTFPHSGGVTVLESVYMGVPMVTLYNNQPGGRTPSVVFRAIGRDNWIADSVSDYVNKAVKLSEQRTELREARQTLRDELMKSGIVGPDYVRAVEQAYRQMWWRWCGHDADHSRDTGLAAGGQRVESSLRA